MRIVIQDSSIDMSAEIIQISSYYDLPILYLVECYGDFGDYKSGTFFNNFLEYLTIKTNSSQLF